MRYNVLFDTNILIDMTTADRPQHAEARQLAILARAGCLHVSVVASSLKDVYYILRRHDDGKVRDFIRFFLDAFTVLAVDHAVCRRAVDSDEPDFEDGVIRAVAEMEGMDFIVTRDEAAYARSTVRALDASTLLELVAASCGDAAS